MSLRKKHSYELNPRTEIKNLNSFKFMVEALKEEVEKRNMIILLCTEPNLYNFPFKFGDQLYDLYVTGKNNNGNHK